MLTISTKTSVGKNLIKTSGTQHELFWHLKILLKTPDKMSVEGNIKPRYSNWENLQIYLQQRAVTALCRTRGKATGQLEWLNSENKSWRRSWALRSFIFSPNQYCSFSTSQNQISGSQTNYRAHHAHCYIKQVSSTLVLTPLPKKKLFLPSSS